MFNENVYKIVLSKPLKSKTDFKRIEIVKNEDLFQASMYAEKKVTHKNFGANEARDFVKQLFCEQFLQYNAWDEQFEYESRASKKGKVTSARKAAVNPPKKPVFSGSGFNRQKNHLITEGDEIHALVDMGVFTKDFKLIKSKRDKFVQINRFLEIVSDEVHKLNPGTKLSIIDIGCGKSYLTFLLYHFFSVMRGFDVEVCGLDSNEDLVKKCQSTAEANDYFNLSFEVADIKEMESPPIKNFGGKDRFSIAISLHACDIATDFAISRAIKWNANLVLVAPCCQHELAGQLKPKNLTILADYGIIGERFSSIATDLVRAKMLESAGYRVQILEFVGFLFTEKNLLIRARKTGIQNESALDDIRKLNDEFGFSPTLLKQ